MNGSENYLLGILKQILESYEFLKRIRDKPGDLEVIKKELAKINGLIQVLVNKLEISGNDSDDFVALSKSAKFYLENHDFTREIQIMAPLYSNDTDRLKNIRYAILDSLQEKKLVEKMQTIIDKSQ